jgi:hypothetical protein
MAAARLTGPFAADGPFAKAARLLENQAGVRLTVKRAGRVAEASGTAKAGADRDRAALITARKLVPLSPSPLLDKLYAAMDGTGVPVTAKETDGWNGKGDDGRARTRKVKLAVVFTQDKMDEDGYRCGTGTPALHRHPRARSCVRELRAGRGASASAPVTFGSSPSSATARPGSGTSPPASFPAPPRSWTGTTLASACTTSPGSLEFMLLDRTEGLLGARPGTSLVLLVHPPTGVRLGVWSPVTCWFGAGRPRVTLPVLRT